MYRRFIFESDIHTTLDCVPLAVRRKLDLAMLKISLEGWQRLSRSERLTLCHLPVDSEDEIEVYREVMQGFCARADVPLRPLEDSNASARRWNAPDVPEQLRSRTAELGVAWSDALWASFDEEIRYALLKLADPKRNPEKIRSLLVELGLLPGPVHLCPPRVVVCAPSGDS